jgi:hypothetical protein
MLQTQPMLQTLTHPCADCGRPWSFRIDMQDAPRFRLCYLCDPCLTARVLRVKEQAALTSERRGRYRMTAAPVRRRRQL